MKRCRLIELVSLPEPEAARFESRPDGGRTLILEMDSLTKDEETSMDIGLIRGEPVQLVAVHRYPSSRDISMLYMVQSDQDPPKWPAEISVMPIPPMIIEDELPEEELTDDEPPPYADTVQIHYGRVIPFHAERDPTDVEEFVVSHNIEIDPIGLEEILFPLFFSIGAG